MSFCTPRKTTKSCYWKKISNWCHLSCDSSVMGMRRTATTMCGDFKGSPSRRHWNIDYYSESESGSHGFSADEDDSSGTFDIVGATRAPVDRLRRWRQAALVLNASRRFRYTLDSNEATERNQRIAKIRTHAQVVRAVVLLQAAGRGVNVSGTPELLPSTSTCDDDFEISKEELSQMSRDQDLSTLHGNGGVKGVADKLKASLEKGIHGDETDLLNRKDSFGSNTYPRRKGKSFWRFLWEACRDTTLIILMVVAAASLALNIETEGIKEGWFDGGSIALAVVIVIVLTAISDYRQSHQFQSLNEETQNICLEVVRDGRRVEVPIFDIVVGDIVSLKIGDQVPADGILISGHSLAIDESSMNSNGESKIVSKDPKAPFLRSRCKVADGYGVMLVTSVGINTQWGLQMASISEDVTEEPPAQVRLNGVVTFNGIDGLVVAAFVLLVLVIRYFTGYTFEPDEGFQFLVGKTKVGSAVDGAIKILIVAAVVVAHDFRRFLRLMRQRCRCRVFFFLKKSSARTEFNLSIQSTDKQNPCEKM